MTNNIVVIASRRNQFKYYKGTVTLLLQHFSYQNSTTGMATHPIQTVDRTRFRSTRISPEDGVDIYHSAARLGRLRPSRSRGRRGFSDATRRPARLAPGLERMCAARGRSTAHVRRSSHRERYDPDARFRSRSVGTGTE